MVERTGLHPTLLRNHTLRLFGAASLLLLQTACTTPTPDSPEVTARNFMGAILAQDLGQAISQLTPDSSKDLQVTSQLTPLIKSLAGCEMGQVTSSNQETTVSFKEECGDGGTDTNGQKITYSGTRLNLALVSNHYYINPDGSSLIRAPLKEVAPAPTTTPDPNKRKLFYFEHCLDCGGEFSVDQLELLGDAFRVHVSIKNTGEQGDLGLIMNESALFALDGIQATRYQAGLKKAIEAGNVSGLIDEIKPSYFEIKPEEVSKLPATLRFGQSWSGWFRTNKPLPREAVGLYIGLYPINRSKPTNGQSTSTWISVDETQPFVEIPLR